MLPRLKELRRLPQILDLVALTIRHAACQGMALAPACRARPEEPVRGVSWSEVATVPKRKSHRGLDSNLSWNSEEDIWKGRKESNGKK